MACICGGVISDTVCPCPTEGWILRDQDQELYFDGASGDITAFFVAIQTGRRDAWISEFFSPQFPTDISNEAIVFDILAFHKRALFLSIAECARCGRLLVQHAPGVNAYRGYSPDEQKYAAVLRAQPEPSVVVHPPQP
jgi:hypothetical protein